jgi:hypothetical protein
MSSDDRVAQYRSVAESSLAVAKRVAELRSLACFLHKHQSDSFGGTTRANLALAIEAHRARAAGCVDALIALLETALKMPDRVFNEAHKSRFLRWLAECEASAATASMEAAEAVQHRLLEVADADVGAGEVCLLEVDGEVYAGAAPRVAAAAGGVPALAAALAVAAARGGALYARVTAAGEVVGWEEGGGVP